MFIQNVIINSIISNCNKTYTNSKITTYERQTKTKAKSEFDAPLSKPIFTSYYGDYSCEGANDCQGDFDTTPHESIKNIQPMWKINLKKASGEYGITRTNIFFGRKKIFF